MLELLTEFTALNTLNAFSRHTNKRVIDKKGKILH